MSRILLKIAIGFVAGLAFALSSCSSDEFKVKGEIYGAEDMKMALEKPDFQGLWVTVDSIKINRNGGFSYTFPAPASPEIFRLALNGQYVYFPVENKETITINTSYEKFGHDFTLAGSHTAEKMADFEKELQQAPYSEPDSLTDFKRTVYSKYIKDNPGSILNFYILTKVINGKPLYNPADNNDRKYFTAVATGYQSAAPDDPHAAILEQTALQALREKHRESGRYQQIEAEEVSIIDMDLQNEKGENVKLSDVAGKGKPTVVVFSLLNHQDSPEFNMALAKIYKNWNGKAEIYNVSLDADQYAWREAARNLPWITVYSPGQASSEDALRYNVYELPAIFIYNANGELTGRAKGLEELSGEKFN